jgi:hypothetical protein
VLPPPTGEPLTIQRLCLAYSDFAETYYVKDGKPTAEVDCVTYALQRLIKLYGTTSAAEFGPKALKLVRDEYKPRDDARFDREYQPFEPASKGWRFS